MASGIKREGRMDETVKAGAPAEADTSARVATPVHLWIIGAISLLWNAFGAADYSMTAMRHPAVVAQITAAQMAWLDAFPAWATGAWALGTWGSVVGSILLLARSRHAVSAFIVSLVGVAGVTLYQYVVTPPPVEFRGPASTAMSAAIWAIAIALLLYARAMRARGVLR